VKQLPRERQQSLFDFLLTNQWGSWVEFSGYGQERVRQVASGRGRDWGAMSEEDREGLIDEIVHEDRQCRQ
jgi:hypothetical protein